MWIKALCFVKFKVFFFDLEFLNLFCAKKESYPKKWLN